MVVNTCAFIEAARQESIDTILELADSRRAGSRLVVTGCLAERYGSELSDALPEVDLVAGFGVPVTLRRRNAFDLLNLPRPAATRPVGLYKGGRGVRPPLRVLRHPVVPGAPAVPARPTPCSRRSTPSVSGVREIVLVAQDLASWGLDRSDPGPGRRGPGGAPRPIVELIRAVAGRVERVRLLYLYPSALDDELVETIVDTGVPYFDLSLQHVSRPLVETDEAVGRRRALPRPDRSASGRPPPTPRCGRRSSSAIRGRRRRITTRCSTSWTRRSSTGPVSSPSPRSRGPTPPDSPARCRPSWPSNVCGSAPRSRTGSPPSAGRRSWARR